MTNANYTRFISAFGKLCYGYDQAAANVTTQQQTQYRSMEQFAKSNQEFTNLPEIGVLAANFSLWSAAIQQGPTSIQTLMISIAAKILQSTDFIAALVTVPANNSLANVMGAWNTDMTNDSKTLTTATTSGLANFLNQVTGVVVTNTSGSPTYADGTYVILAIA